MSPKQSGGSLHKPTDLSVLTGASGISITHGEFNNVGGDLVRNFNSSTVVSNGNRSLWDAIAGVGASHNSQLRFPPPRCHPKTREGVTNVLLKWIDSGSRDLPVCWLSGPAGAGKSAIAQTIAEIHERDALVTSFFFFRQDPKRNNPEYLILTIAHGLVVNVPELRQPITQRIAADPKILESSLKDQFRDLVVNPLLAQREWWNRLRRLWADWPRPSRRRPNLVIIDGLDECGNEQTQTDILKVLASALGKHPDLLYPLRFLVCSRPEPWIREVFDSSQLRNFRKYIVLDESFSPDTDIERYLRDGFQDISTSPKYSQILFSAPWPPDHDIRTLVDKARGQFIYAATVLKFVRDGFLHPLEQLRIILKNPSHDISPSPFQELDHLYQVILSANPNRDGLLAVLAAILFLPLVEAPTTPQFIEKLLGLPNGQVALTLRPMHSVLDIQGRDDVIVVFHASFTDFLYDQSRSGEFFLDQRRWQGFVLRKWLHVLVGHNREGLLAVLASILILPLGEAPATPPFIERLLGLPDGQVVLILTPMDSVLNIGGRNITIVPAWFTDFLYDHSRSGEFFLDQRRWHDFLVHRWLHILTEECKEKWPSFCAALDDYPSAAVISSLRELDLSTLLTAAISSSLLVINELDHALGENRKVPPFLPSLWEKLEVIVSWLRSKDSYGTLSDLIKYFEGAREGFHVAISSDIAQIFAMWTVLNIADCGHNSTLTDRVDSAMISYIRRSFSMPVAYYNSCQVGSAATSEVPSQCPLAPVGHYHINLRALSALTLEAFKGTLHDSRSFTLGDGLVLNVFGSALLHLCGPDPRALALCHRFLSFRTAHRVSLDSKTLERVLDWLKSFPDQYIDEIGELRRKLEIDTDFSSLS